MNIQRHLQVLEVLSSSSSSSAEGYAEVASRLSPAADRPYCDRRLEIRCRAKNWLCLTEREADYLFSLRTPEELANAPEFLEDFAREELEDLRAAESYERGRL